MAPTKVCGCTIACSQEAGTEIRGYMKRRAFFKTAALAGLAAPLTVREAAGHVVAHNWDKYDFGSGPVVNDRLNQGPFPEYAPEDLYPGGEVVMADHSDG